MEHRVLIVGKRAYENGANGINVCVDGKVHLSLDYCGQLCGVTVTDRDILSIDNEFCSTHPTQWYVIGPCGGFCELQMELPPQAEEAIKGWEMKQNSRKLKLQR